MTAEQPSTRRLENVLYDKKGGVAYVTLNRPKVLNALNTPTWADLRTAFEDARDDAAVRGVILTGAGDKAFIAGADISELAHASAIDAERASRLGQGVLDLVENLGKPVVAAINGFALGGGCELSLACDFRLMADHAKIGVPEVRIGALAGAGGVQKLHRLVGRGKALEWILLGSHVTAPEALARGMLTSVHAASDLMPAALELAGRFRLLGPRAVAQSKMAVRMCGDADLNTARSIGLEALSMLIGGPEWQEGMAAFMEKRLPRFPPLQAASPDPKAKSTGSG
jgi:enoyl-CoA hydratase/carnithine racemase